MQIIELTAEANYGYMSFFTTGLALHRDCFRISPQEAEKEPFPTKATADNFTLAAVSAENELMGVVSFAREGATREKLRHKGLLFRMYVAAKHSGKGIGKLLIEETVKRVKTQTNIEQINLTVIASNIPAKRLYEKAGFTTFSVEKNAIKDGEVYYTEEQMVLFVK